MSQGHSFAHKDIKEELDLQFFGDISIFIFLFIVETKPGVLTNIICVYTCVD